MNRNVHITCSRRVCRHRDRVVNIAHTRWEIQRISHVCVAIGMQCMRAAVDGRWTDCFPLALHSMHTDIRVRFAQKLQNQSPFDCIEWVHSLSLNAESQSHERSRTRAFHCDIINKLHHHSNAADDCYRLRSHCLRFPFVCVCESAYESICLTGFSHRMQSLVCARTIKMKAQRREMHGKMYRNIQRTAGEAHRQRRALCEANQY